jgi:hypothetical protein
MSQQIDFGRCFNCPEQRERGKATLQQRPVLPPYCFGSTIFWYLKKKERTFLIPAPLSGGVGKDGFSLF